MKFRGLLIAVVLLAGLGGLLYWSNKQEKGKEGKTSSDTAPKMLTIPEDQVKEVRLKKAGGQPTVVRMGDDGKWQIIEPKPLPADQDSVKSLVTTVASLNADKLVEEKAADLSPYGLNSPALGVTVLKKDGKAVDLTVGDEVLTGSGAYAKISNDPRVFTIASYVKSNLEKTPNDLRDRRLLTFNSEKITRVELQAKGQTVEFGKNNQNDWQILKPKPLRADGSQVDELVRKLKDAKMDLSVSEDQTKKLESDFSAATKVAVANVTDAGGSQQIEVRKDKDKNYYAKSSAVPGVFKAFSELGEGLDKGLEDFRNKKLLDFGWNDPTKVEIHTGSTTVSYQKSGDKWMAGTKQMDSPSVQALIDKLRDLSAAKFVESGGGGAPVLDAKVTSNDGKRVEKAIITKQGATYFATRENEPGIYELDTKAVEDLQKAAAEVKEYQQPKKT
jgi:hypothetical protein